LFTDFIAIATREHSQGGNARDLLLFSDPIRMAEPEQRSKLKIASAMYVYRA
jgi:hypothetical protein